MVNLLYKCRSDYHSIMDDIKILRYYPHKKDKLKYPFRYTRSIFDEYNELINTRDFLANYISWKNGINFKTNIKIKIGGDLHSRLKNVFMIQLRDWTKSYWEYDKYNDRSKVDAILFDELSNIDPELYLRETDEIKRKIDDQNKPILEYNNLVNETIEKINNLEKWGDFIEFENNYYGIPVVYKNIHKENDCNGNIVKDRYERCSCSRCENWYGCKNINGYQYYKCDACDYKYNIVDKWEWSWNGK